VLPPNFYNQADQGIYAAGDFFIPQEKFRAAPYNVNTPNNPDDVPAGIPAIYQSQGGGGGGYTGGVSDLIKNYTLDTRKQYFGSQPTPLVDDLYQSKLDKTFMGFPSYRQVDPIGPFTPYNQPMNMDDPAASIENIIASRNVPLELTTAGKVQNTLGNIKDTASGIMSKIGGIGPVSMLLGSMDKFDTLSAADQEFIKQNMGYTGPTVFGDNSSGLSKDPFGLNTRSAFGNYAERVGKEATSLGASLSADGAIGGKKDFQGATFNAATGMFEADDDSDLTPEQVAALNQRTKMVRAKYNFYTQKEKERVANEELMEQQAIEEAKAKAARDNAGTQRRSDGSGGGNLSRSRDQGGLGLSASQAQSVSAANAAAGMGGWGLADGGRVPYMDGGIADMLEIYD